MKRILGLISLVPVIFASCAYSTQDVRIAPVLSVVPSTIGEQKTVELKVVDDRDDKNIGRRVEMHNVGAMITNSQDLEQVFRDKLKEGLEAKGFKVVETGNPERALKVEIRTIKYTTSAGIVRAGFLVNASMKALAKNGTETYEKMYRSDENEKGFFLPFADENEAQINAAVSGVFAQFFGDEELFTLLAK